MEVCGTCAGREALLSDLEDLSKLMPGLGKVGKIKCLNACYTPPNAVVRPACGGGEGGSGNVNTKRGAPRLATELNSFEAVLAMAQEASGCGSEGLAIPQEELHRSRLRSDAMRRISVGTSRAMTEADAMLTEALELERCRSTGSQEKPKQSSRERHLLLLRAEVRGSRVLQRIDEALVDLDEVLQAHPESMEAHAAKGVILKRIRRWTEALACFHAALALAGQPRDSHLRGCSAAAYTASWLRTGAAELEDRISEEASGDICVRPSLLPESEGTSGDGSGWWKVVKIVGLSRNTCCYHLENCPPAVPHPHPRALWHVGVRFGATAREYTPVSTAAEWEQGRMSLVVKTYSGGAASKRFAALLPANNVARLDEQPCWLLVTTPRPTLPLPTLNTVPSEVAAQRKKPIEHLCLLVGGTGGTAALQLLRHVADTKGPFGSKCRATLIYSSRSPIEVLLLDELRAVQAAGDGRITVHHTLTDAQANAMSFFKQANDGSHNFHSLPAWRPYTPKGGALQTAAGKEAGLRGRVTEAMLQEFLPAPARGVHIVVCGPPLMWEDVRSIAITLGHPVDSLTELKALAVAQC